MARHWTTILGAVFALIGAILAWVGYRGKDWSPLIWGGILLILGVILMLQLEAISNLFFRVLGRRPDWAG